MNRLHERSIADPGAQGEQACTCAAEIAELRREIEYYAQRLAHERADRLRAEEALQTMAKQLQRSKGELQDFAHIASHDLQEPLRKVDAFGDLLLARYGEQLSSEGRDYVERMRSAAQRMKRLIADLLELSRVATRAQPSVPVELAEVAREAVGNLEARIEETGGRVELGALPIVEGDPAQLRQLLQNLIGNALKFHSPGTQPVVAVSCRQLAEAHDQHCELRITDNGIGFDQKHHDRIFAPFQRLHGRTQYEGSGMGLAICKRIVERHHGTLTATGVPGHGATFYVTLPLKQPASIA